MNRQQSNNNHFQAGSFAACALSIHHVALAHDRLSTVTTPIIITIPFAQGVGTSF